MGNQDSKGGQGIEVLIRTKTFTKDSCGLFDRAAKEFKLQEFDLNEDGVLALYKDDVVMLKRETKRKDLYNIMRFQFNHEGMAASHCSKQYTSLEGFDESKIKGRKDFHERFIWKSISMESGGEALDINDIFRMGRLRFRVREVWDQKGQRSIGLKGMDNHVEYAEHHTQDEEVYCRVCMEPQNPAKEFANVCDCAKRMPIHADCLMDWIKTKMNKRVTDAYEFYTWKGLECDICKKTYPEYFMANQQRYSLLTYDRPPQPYIVLDLYNKEANTLRGCFVIKRAKDNLRIGRGQDCDIRLSDISISRSHSRLFYHNGTYHINDTKSKFGTMIMLRKPALFSPLSQASIYQIGKVVVEIYPKKTEAKCMAICAAKQRPTNLRKNPFISLPDEPDYLSETMIEEKEREEKERQELQKRQSQRNINHSHRSGANVNEQEVMHPDNIGVQQNNLSGRASQIQASQHQPGSIHQSRHSNMQRGGPQGANAGGQAGAQQPQQPPGQPGHPITDDDLFNSNYFRGERGNEPADDQAEDDYDFDFESSAEDDNPARQNVPNVRNFETNQDRHN